MKSKERYEGEYISASNPLMQMKRYDENSSAFSLHSPEEEMISSVVRG
jgi:hypothetical protein